MLGYIKLVMTSDNTPSNESADSITVYIFIVIKVSGYGKRWAKPKKKKNLFYLLKMSSDMQEKRLIQELQEQYQGNITILDALRHFIISLDRRKLSFNKNHCHLCWITWCHKIKHRNLELILLESIRKPKLKIWLTLFLITKMFFSLNK